MENRGKQITCDRCGDRIFLKEIGSDHGLVYNYEENPENWTKKCFGDDVLNLCPKCTDAFDRTKDEFLATYWRAAMNDDEVEPHPPYKNANYKPIDTSDAYLQ